VGFFFVDNSQNLRENLQFLADDCGDFVISLARLFFQTSGKEILYFIMDIYIAIHGDSIMKKVNVKFYLQLCAFFLITRVNKRILGFGCDKVAN
jgi:hypothetical protein